MIIYAQEQRIDLHIWRHWKPVHKTWDINNLSAQPSKLGLAFPLITFPGYKINQDGLHVTDNRVKILKAFKLFGALVQTVIKEHITCVCC